VCTPGCGCVFQSVEFGGGQFGVAEVVGGTGGLFEDYGVEYEGFV
jgi:hypothetical protein